MQTIRVIIMTTNQLIENGIRSIIEKDARPVSVVAAVDTVATCQDALHEYRAQVILLDDGGIPATYPEQVIQQLVTGESHPRIIVLSEHLSENFIQRLLNHGAHGFIYKQDSLEETLVTGIKTVQSGQIFLSPRAAALPYDSTGDDALNSTDREVLQLIADGYTAQEIAARVQVVVRSVYRIRSKLREYLGVRTSEQIVDAARKRGLLKSESC